MADVSQESGHRLTLNLEASPVQGQLGSAVLDLNGRLIQCGGQLSDHNAIILYKMLLEAGADPTIKNDLGLTAIDFAERVKKSDSTAIIAAFIRGRRPKGAW